MKKITLFIMDVSVTKKNSHTEARSNRRVFKKYHILKKKSKKFIRFYTINVNGYSKYT